MLLQYNEELIRKKRLQQKRKELVLKKVAGLAYYKLINKKAHTCEVGVAHRRISNFHLFTNLKNNSFQGFKCIHTSIFITITFYYISYFHYYYN